MHRGEAHMSTSGTCFISGWKKSQPGFSNTASVIFTTQSSYGHSCFFLWLTFLNYYLVFRCGSLSFKSVWTVLLKWKSKPHNEWASEIISVVFPLFKKKRKKKEAVSVLLWSRQIRYIFEIKKSWCLWEEQSAASFFCLKRCSGRH